MSENGKVHFRRFLEFAKHNSLVVIFGFFPPFIFILVVSSNTYLTSSRFETDGVFFTQPGFGLIAGLILSITATLWLLKISLLEHPIFAALILIVVLPVHFALAYYVLEHSVTNCVANMDDFGTALYFSVTTFTTLGYGDYSPLGVCRAITSAQSLLGLFTLGTIPAVILAKAMKEM